jgi:hypothetical protein
MNRQGNRFAKLQGLDPLLQVIDAPFECERIVFPAGSGRQSAPDVVGNQDSILVPKGYDEVAIQKRPGGIAVDEEHRLSLALIQVMQSLSGDEAVMGGKRVINPKRLLNGLQDVIPSP